MVDIWWIYGWSMDNPWIIYGESMDNLWIWLVAKPPIWKIWVNWDDDIPNIWKNKSHVPNHQPVTGLEWILWPKDPNISELRCTWTGFKNGQQELETDDKGSLICLRKLMSQETHSCLCRKWKANVISRNLCVLIQTHVWEQSWEFRFKIWHDHKLKHGSAWSTVLICSYHASVQLQYLQHLKYWQFWHSHFPTLLISNMSRDSQATCSKKQSVWPTKTKHTCNRLCWEMVTCSILYTSIYCLCDLLTIGFLET